MGPGRAWRRSSRLEGCVRRDAGRGVVAQFKDEVGPGGFQAYVKFVEDVIAPERDPAIDIWLSGQPSYLSQLEIYAQRIGLLFLIAVVITGLVHYEAFRTRQGSSCRWSPRCSRSCGGSAS